ncbi:MAG: radical SAM protein [Pseudomonadota bacterium]
MRILLIKPRWEIGYGQMRYAKRVRFPALGLGILAALSPGHYVKVVDGNWDPIPFDGDWDLVGITVTTFAAGTAYDLAARFRARGAKVVLGGIHPTIMTAEAGAHADAVVVGEAEGVWPTLLLDAARGKLEPVYRAEEPTDMTTVPLARRDVLVEAPWFTAVEASRGCPNKCIYCYLPATPWARFRPRPVEHVVEEVRSLPQSVFIFVDENIFTDRLHAIRLFRALAPLKKKWLVQMPTDRADDDELLDAMAEGGCFNVHMGFQSFNKESLADAQVDHAPRVEKYREIVKRLHARRIVVSGFFVFGFDGDRPDAFDTTVAAIKSIGVDDAGMFIATPYPGTQFHRRFQEQGRLLEGATSDHFGWNRAVFQPRHMDPETLERGVRHAYDALKGHFIRRLIWVMRTQLPVVLRAPRLGWVFLAGTFRPHHLDARARP